MNVHVIILARRRGRLPDIGESRKMHDGVDRTRGEHRIQRAGITNVALDQLSPADEFAMAE
jgi:hypothetical protein